MVAFSALYLLGSSSSLYRVFTSVNEKLGGTDSISRGRMRHCPISTTDERPSKGIQRTGPGES